MRAKKGSVLPLLAVLFILVALVVTVSRLQERRTSDSKAEEARTRTRLSASEGSLTTGTVHVFADNPFEIPSINPSPGNTVLLFVGAITSDPTPIPSITGGGATWELVTTVTRREDSPRRLSLFKAKNVGSGPLTVSFSRTEQSRSTWFWSVVQVQGDVKQVTQEVPNNFVTSKSLSFESISADNTVIAGFFVGQPGKVSASQGSTILEQANSLRATLATGLSASKDIGVTWEERAHAMGIAAEIEKK